MYRFSATTCSQGRFYNGHCYEFYLEEQDKKTWNDARSECQNIEQGWELVSILSQEEEEWIHGNSGIMGFDWWIGYSQIQSGTFVPGDFVWSDGSNNGYEHWKSGQPNNAGVRTSTPLQIT